MSHNKGIISLAPIPVLLEEVVAAHSKKNWTLEKDLEGPPPPARNNNQKMCYEVPVSRCANLNYCKKTANSCHYNEQLLGLFAKKIESLKFNEIVRPGSELATMDVKSIIRDIDMSSYYRFNNVIRLKLADHVQGSSHINQLALLYFIAKAHKNIPAYDFPYSGVDQILKERKPLMEKAAELRRLSLEPWLWKKKYYIKAAKMVGVLVGTVALAGFLAEQRSSAIQPSMWDNFLSVYNKMIHGIIVEKTYDQQLYDLWISANEILTSMMTQKPKQWSILS
jgi:hypothetical protein